MAQNETLEDFQTEEPEVPKSNDQETVSFAYELPEMVLGAQDIHITLELPESLFFREVVVDNQEDPALKTEVKNLKKGFWSGIKGLAKKFWSFFTNLIFL